MLICNIIVNDILLPSFLIFLSPQNVGYVFGSSTRGQRSLYDTGLTGIPITNCNNNCSTGSTALFLSRNLVAGGMADCALALGFEKMQKGSLAVDDDDVNPLGMSVYNVCMSIMNAKACCSFICREACCDDEQGHWWTPKCSSSSMDVCTGWKTTLREV